MTAYYLTADEIMTVYNVSRSYVYRMASERQWRRYRDAQRVVHYRVEDVGDTLRGGNTRAA